ncbi:MAG: phospho-sugar mutase [Cryomorphaceae bacterium]|nr:phospho-sugar mutase [Cryomorphaceae bacterium]
MNDTILEKAKVWTDSPFDSITRAAVKDLMENHPEELYESFYKDIDFGTGGMRGIMGVGTNRINKYTLGQASEGLSRYLKSQFPDDEIRIAIAHDTRNNSEELTEAISAIFSGHGFRVFLFDSFAPTPMLSFAVRQLKCHAGIVLTASHNPPEYNGYKVYWNDGAQIVPPHDKKIIESVRNTDYGTLNFSGNPDKITTLSDELNETYFNLLRGVGIHHSGKEYIKIVFTPLHGTTVHLLPAALEATGFNSPLLVVEQSIPDGNFSTVKSPNPEEAEALAAAMQLASDEDADLVIGTDPDGDRIGIGVKGEKNDYVLLNGNQTAAVLIKYLLSEKAGNGTLPDNAFIAKTIVTTDLLSDIAGTYNVECHECLTGFKWIADLIRKFEGKKVFIGGGEESYGYLIGDFVRDKDSIVAAVILAEIVAWAKQRGSSFYRELMEIYAQYGYYHDQLHSLTLKGSEGAERINTMMQAFRQSPPTSLMGEKVLQMKDFKSLEETDVATGKKKSFTFESSNVLQFFTENGSRITVRPSGTEPKIKFYFSLKQAVHNGIAIADLMAQGREKVAECIRELNL